MKKTLSILLILTMVLSMVPFAFAEGDGVEVPVPTATITVTEEFSYTQGGETVTDEVKVTVSDPSSASSVNEVLVVEKNIEEKVNGTVTENEHDMAVVTDEDIIVQKSPTEGEVVTVAGDTGTAVEGGNDACVHDWVKQDSDCVAPTCNSFGKNVYICSKCKAEKIEEVAMTAHTIPTGAGAKPEKTVDCVEKRYYVYKCTKCSELFKVYDNEHIQAGHHDYKDGICTKCEDVDHTAGVINNTVGQPTYSFEDDTLIVAGEGEIPDYKVEITGVDGATVDVPVEEVTPWNNFASKVINLVIGSGIKRIGDFAFSNLNNLKQVDIYSEKIEIGDYAFAGDEKLEDVNMISYNGQVAYDNPVATVSIEENDIIVSDVGSTAFLGDGTVSVNYSCVNPKAAEQEKTQKFAFANVVHDCLHLNCSTIYGKDPTEKEFGISNGLYCNDCKKVVQQQYKIYPNGKPETGKYVITDFKKLKEIPEGLKKTKYNTLEKISELVERFKENLAKVFKKEFKSELLKDNYKIYYIELKELKTAVEPEKHIVNLPYPTGTWPEGYEYLVIQLDKDDEFEEVDTFLTNKGIQVEIETLNPVAICWKAK